MRLGNLEGQITNLWTVVKDSGELAAAVSSYTFSGLDGNTDCEYHLICRFIDDTTVGDYKLTFNTDTGNNYGYQDMSGINGTAAAARDTSEAYWHIGQTSTDDYICFSETYIQAKAGFVRTGITTYAYDITGTTVTGIFKRASSWNNTADNITQIVITPTADKINIGSRFILLKKCHNTGMKTGTITPTSIKGTWQTICNYTVAGAAISSYQVTGIAGNTYPVYRVRVRGVDKDTVGNWYLRMNNVSTADIYGKQFLDGTNTNVAAWRGTLTGMIIGYTGTDSYLTYSDNLLYIKSGFVRTCLGNMTDTITGTTVSAVQIYGQSFNNTADEITTFDFVPAADKFNIGTNIIVERLVL